MAEDAWIGKCVIGDHRESPGAKVHFWVKWPADKPLYLSKDGKWTPDQALFDSRADATAVLMKAPKPPGAE